MSNSTFAAAANAINYSDDNGKVSLEAEEVSDVSVASSNDSDNDSNNGSNNNNDNDNDNVDMEEAVFLCDARDIQNRTSRSVGMPAMEDRQFHSLFWARIEIILKVWLMLWKDGLRSKKSKPKPLLWTLYFLKVYPREAPGCSAVGKSKGAIHPKTLQKWVRLFIERIAELVDNGVSLFVVPMLTSLYIVASPPHHRAPLPSRRSPLRAGLVPTTWATTAS